jgi:hypothetical protein
MVSSVILDPQGVAFQTETGIPDTAWSKDERDRIITKLTKPFPLSDIRWMLVEKSKDRTTGRMAPYVKSNVLIDRLNEVLGIGMWKKTYPRQETRDVTCKDTKNEQASVRRSRVSLTCRLVLPSIGEQEANGEEWADDQNATTSADAQAFKRACKCFGIGSYLDRLGASVDLDTKGKPKALPTIPFAFLAEADKKSAKEAEESARNRTKGHGPALPGKAQATATEQPPVGNSQPVAGSFDKKAIEEKIRVYKDTLGDALYAEIVTKIKGEFPPKTPGSVVNQKITSALDAAVASLARVRDVAANVPQNAFDEVMDAFGVETLTTIPSAEVLEGMLRSLEDVRSGKPF